MRIFKNLSQKEKQQILQDKKDNPFTTVTQLSEKYKIHKDSISIWLRKNHCTTKELTGIRNRKYNVNDNYFEHINSYNKAYLLGVFYSDGYLVTEGITKRIGLDVKDTEWLQSIGKELESEAPLYKTAKEQLKRLKITSPKMYEDLKKLGCVENKTFLLKFPTVEQVPKEFQLAFILGLWDGDGSIVICTPRKSTHQPSFKIDLTGTKELLEGVQRVLNLSHIKLYQRFPERNRNNWTLSVHGVNNVAQVLNKIYKDAPTFCLKRKHEKFQTIMNDSRIKSKDLMLHPANLDCNKV